MTKKTPLLVAYILDGQGGGRQIDWNEINHWTPEQGVLWVHLNYSTKRAQTWLLQESHLNPITAKAMMSEETRPRSVVTSNGLLVFLRSVNLNPGQDPEDMVSVRTWIGDNRIITTRQRPVLSIDDLCSAIEKGTGPKKPSDFLILLNVYLLNRMSDVLENIDEQVDQLEEAIITEQSYLLRPKIADLRRQAILIRRYLAPQREALTRLQMSDIPLLKPQDIISLREETDRIIRYIEDLDSARDRLAITQEELTSRLSEQLDRRMYLLSVVAILFLPLTFITGLLGINVAGIPGATNQWAFTIVCFSLTGLLIVTLWICHLKKWI